MEIEGNDIAKSRKITLKQYLRQNKMYLESIFEDDINLPSILVKFVDEKDFEEIWKTKPCGKFYEEYFVSILRNLMGEQIEVSDQQRDIYLQYLLNNTHYCEPIVAFVSDIKFECYMHDEFLTSPGIYVKNKENDDINLDFGILYSLIKAQIYYSMSRTDILSFSLSPCCKYEVIDSVLYSAMALKVMKDSDFEKLIENQIKSRRLAGSWAIPLDLLILSYSDRDALDDILEPELIRRVFFREDIDEEKWLREITEKVCAGYI